jgi:hypothetical protein
MVAGVGAGGNKAIAIYKIENQLKPHANCYSATLCIAPRDDSQIVFRPIAGNQESRTCANCCPCNDIIPVVLVCFHTCKTNEAGNGKSGDARAAALPVKERRRGGKALRGMSRWEAFKVAPIGPAFGKCRF